VFQTSPECSKLCHHNEFKLKKEAGIALVVDQPMDEDFVVALELFLLASNIKKEVCGMLDSLIPSFLKRYKERKAHNMLSLMLDSQFKSLHLLFSFVHYEQNMSIVEEYDKKSLHFIFLKHYHHLHLVANCEIGFVNQRIDENCSLDFFSNDC
jgi:hypothetical protein